MKDIDRIIENLLNLDKGMYVEGMGREAADAISDLTKRLEAHTSALQTVKLRCESACEEARSKGDAPAGFLFEGGYSACEAIDAEIITLLSREHASERQLPRDPLANNPTDSDENAP